MTAIPVGRLGKRLPIFPKSLRELQHYATKELPAPPLWVYHEKAVPYFSMAGNDQYGCCTISAASHMQQSWDIQTSEHDVIPTTAQVINSYMYLTGGKDDGLIMSDVLYRWRVFGLWRNKIVAYAPINTHAVTLMKQAVAFYGAAYIGFQFPVNGFHQFDAHLPWTLDNNWRAQKIVGGHAVAVLGYDQYWLYVVTWGRVQKMSYDWWSVYGDEAYCVIPNQFKEAAVVGGIDLASLEADLANV